MASTVKFLDPVQGLIDYVNDIKPYHTKVIESLIEYVSQETIEITLLEDFAFNIELIYGFDVPRCQTYIALGNETIITATVPVRTKYVTKIVEVGDNPTVLEEYTTTDSYGTIVYKNNIFQEEQFGTPLVGDYSISGNKIIFVNPLSVGDVVGICTVTRSQSIPTLCLDGGYSSLGFDDPDNIPVLSPDPTKTLPEYPSFTTNSFIILGDQRKEFNPGSNLVFKLISFIEDRIVVINESTVGSPVTGGSFALSGDRTSLYSVNDIFVVTGSSNNDTAYKVTAVVVSGSPITTTLEVEGQSVQSGIDDGFVRTLDSNNNGHFSVASSIFTQASNEIREYTTVFVAGLSLVPPAPSSLDSNQRYISLVSIGGLEYKKILSYSNTLKYYDASPASLTQTPDEGIAYAQIVNLSQSSPSYFVVEGNYENSNIFVGDKFSVVSSTGNNDTYTIESVSYGYEPLISDNATILGVSNIPDPAIDGFAKLDIPSNVFIIDGDYTDFFKQGVRIKVITGSKTGIYTTLYSKFINDETQIRVHEDLIHGRGRLIAGTVITPSNGFVVDGDVTATFKQDTQFNVVNSVGNNGSYTVAVDSTYSGSPSSTTILITEAFDSSDNTGEIHEFTKGTLTYLSTGFGQTPELCEVIPETLVSVGIKDRLYFDGLGIWTYDDIIAYGISDEGWGYELPATTIFASAQPTDPVISSTAPVGPTENDLWFDTSLNTGSPSAPGEFKQYVKIFGSPTIFDWVVIETNKAYWIDTDTNYMYYRMIYQHYDNSIPGYPTPSLVNNLDTGWILEYTKIPGYNDHLTGNSSRAEQGFETFFAIESSTAVAETTFTLSTLTIPLTSGSPAVPNPLMLEVYVNNTIAAVDILSTTSFDIISPRLRVGDFIEAKVFDDTAIASSSFVGAFDANAAIVETFDMFLGYKFNITGTESVGSPAVNKMYINDTQNGDTYDIFMQGSPPALVDNEIYIIAPQNLLKYSEQFNDSLWNKYFGSSVVADVATSPIGDLTADQIVFDSTPNGQLTQPVTGLVIGEQYTFSLYVKSDGTTQQPQKLFVSGGVGEIVFTPSNEWSRIILTIVATGTLHSFIILNNPAAISSFYAWGAQVVRGAQVGVYYKTEANEITSNNGNYTILSVSQEGSPIDSLALTVSESLLDTGTFGGSPLIETGIALYQQWFQYFIVNTTANTILVLGDATLDIKNGDSIKIIHSYSSPSNDGTYTVTSTPVYDGRNTTITTVEAITNLGNSGGWVESL